MIGAPWNRCDELRTGPAGLGVDSGLYRSAGDA
jgi:hypothetical protein